MGDNDLLSLETDDCVKSTTREIVSPSLYAVRESRMVATGLLDLAMEKRVLRLACEDDGLRRMMAKSMASFELVGSDMEDARRMCATFGIVGESKPTPDSEVLRRCSSRADT